MQNLILIGLITNLLLPKFLGLKSFDDYDLSELVNRIDWTPFFRTWELAGVYPALLNDPSSWRSLRVGYLKMRKLC